VAAKLCHGDATGTFTFARNVYAEQRGNFLELVVVVVAAMVEAEERRADVVCTAEGQGGEEERRRASAECARKFESNIRNACEILNRQERQSRREIRRFRAIQRRSIYRGGGGVNLFKPARVIKSSLRSRGRCGLRSVLRRIGNTVTSHAAYLRRRFLSCLALIIPDT